MNRILLMFMILGFIILGCSQSTVTNSMTNDAKEIVSIMDKQMKTLEPLTKEEQQQIDLFVQKYVSIRNTEEGKKVMDYFLNMSVALTENIAANTLNNESLRKSSMKDYMKASTEFKKILNIKD